MFPLLKLTEDEIRAYIARVTPSMVRESLAKGRCHYGDLLNLISPVAYEFLPEMQNNAMLCRRRHYGKTVSVYAPLYIGNSCINSCRYCDFNVHHHAVRTNLTLTEIICEAKAIRASGIDSLLIVSGEDPQYATVSFLAEVGHALTPLFSYLALEVAPQSQEAYEALFAAGYEGVTCFQETYNQARYAFLHPAGPKSNFDWRLGTPLRAGRAGMRTLGIAFLLGLDDWRLESASLGAHAFYLMKTCYQSKIQFAFPRITPVSGGFQPDHPVDDRDLELMMLAFRIVFPESGMTVSTREAPAFRDRIVQTCADNMSAGSKVTPGGYSIRAQEDIGQFTLNDARKTAEVFEAITRNGQEVVRKYWDSRL
mgnify:CR=1 FL=1